MVKPSVRGSNIIPPPQPSLVRIHTVHTSPTSRTRSGSRGTLFSSFLFHAPNVSCAFRTRNSWQCRRPTKTAAAAVPRRPTCCRSPRPIVPSSEWIVKRVIFLFFLFYILTRAEPTKPAVTCPWTKTARPAKKAKKTAARTTVAAAATTRATTTRKNNRRPCRLPRRRNRKRNSPGGISKISWRRTRRTRTTRPGRPNR